jgi:CrcB protein
MLAWLLIAIGGGLGSLLRYVMQGWVQRLAGGPFPIGTLTVNLLGCLVIGLLTPLLAEQAFVRHEVRLGLMVGILGGFTTFSTFGLETYHLLAAGQTRLAMANLALSCGLGLAAVLVGHRISERWLAA